MGLLDSLTQSQGGGGLLDFLRSLQSQPQTMSGGLPSDTAQYDQPPAQTQQAPPMAFTPATPQQNAQPSPLDNAQWPAGPNGAPSQAMAQMPPQNPPPVMQAPQAAPSSQYPLPAQSNPGGLGAGVSGFVRNLGTGPVGALIGGIGSAMGVQDPSVGIARQQANNMAAFLKSHGVPDEDIVAAVGDGRIPGNAKTLETILANNVKEKSEIAPATDEQRRAAGIAPGQPLFIDKATGKPTFGPNQTNVSVNTAANPVLEGVGKQIIAQRAVAQTAATSTIPFVHEARQALDEGAITGQFADKRVFAQKVGALFGLPAKDAENTEVFRSAIGNQVLAHVKALGANPSNADRDYIEKIMGGQVSLEEGSLRRLLDMTEKYGRQSIKNFNSDSQKLIEADPAAYKAIAPLMKFEEPGPYSYTKTKAAVSAKQPDMSQAKKAADGNTYIPDPARPGKYLKVTQ